MEKSLILAGFGGQGIQFSSRLLALTGMYLNKSVTWLPSYGAETRGGSSNCTVIVSDEEIGSPVVANPDIVIAMSILAYTKFAARVAPGGIIIADSSMINEKCGRNDITEYFLPATEIADKNNMLKCANIIMLGKLLKITGIFTQEEIVDSLRKSMPESRKELLELNIKALDIGFKHE